MRKCKVLQVLLFYLIFNCWVPNPSFSASDFPNPNPIAFGLANLARLPDHLLTQEQTAASWYFVSGVAQLYGMPELKPYSLQAKGPAIGGHLLFMSNCFTVSSYHEHTIQLGYGRRITHSISGELNLALTQIAIDNYGNAHAFQVIPLVTMQIQPNVQLSAMVFNLNHAYFGAGRYALPQRFVVGCKVGPIESAQLFLELEKDTRYALQTRFAVSYSVFGPLVLLGGFQSEPDIVSAGISVKVSQFQGIASMQYHPDLGYSQCFGIAIQL